jgi:hypothetical protein
LYIIHKTYQLKTENYILSLVDFIFEFPWQLYGAKHMDNKCCNKTKVVPGTSSTLVPDWNILSQQRLNVLDRSLLVYILKEIHANKAIEDLLKDICNLH